MQDVKSAGFGSFRDVGFRYIGFQIQDDTGLALGSLGARYTGVPPLGGGQLCSEGQTKSFASWQKDCLECDEKCSNSSGYRI